MRFTEEMILQEGLWAGLHKPHRSEEEADIVVFGIPYDGAVSFREGSKDGPRSIRDLSYHVTPTSEEFDVFEELKVKDIGDFYGATQEELFKKVEEKVAELVEKKKFFMMLGGDHSTTIPVLRGINRSLGEEFGIIHVDAHFDLCDSLGGNPLSHGCPARRGSELEWVGGSENIYFLAIRSIETDELEFMKHNPVHVISAKKFHQMGTEKVLDTVAEHFKDKKHIYLTFDIDALDPAFAGGTGTPQFGGITSREVLDLVYGISKRLPLIGFDIVEVAPSLDDSLSSSFAARKLILEIWSQIYKKLYTTK